MVQKKDDTDQELVQEFSSLIEKIAKEVTLNVTRDTSLKELEELKVKLEQLRTKAPQLVKNIDFAEQALEATQSRAKEVLDGFTDSIKDQNSELKCHLKNAEKKYTELSNGSYEMFRKAMDAQAANILKKNWENTKNVVGSINEKINQSNNLYSNIIDEFNQDMGVLHEKLDAQSGKIDNILSELTAQKLVIQRVLDEVMLSKSTQEKETKKLKLRANLSIAFSFVILVMFAVIILLAH